MTDIPQLVKELQKISEEYGVVGEAMDELERMHNALKLFRALVKESPGGVPRYTVVPGAALNCLIEEVVDPILRGH